MTRQDDFPKPIFVGGSARSGTHAIGRMLRTHPRYALVKIESRFHCGTGGVTDLVNGKTDFGSFRDRVLGKWWSRGLRQHNGLKRIVERERLESALERLESSLEGDRDAAGRRFIKDVLDPIAEEAGRPAWVDLSGSNIREAPTLHRLFPDARFVHMVRDGRAVTAAILRKRDMTDDLEQAFNHWEMRVRRSDEALRELPPGVVLTIFLDDLTAHDRERQFSRLARHLELDDPGPIREYFDETISPERAHVGAWRERMAPEDARWVDRRYRRLVRRLRRDGIDWVPEPEGR